MLALVLNGILGFELSERWSPTQCFTYCMSGTCRLLIMPVIGRSADMLLRVKTRLTWSLTSRTTPTWRRCRVVSRPNRATSAWSRHRRSRCRQMPWCIAARLWCRRALPSSCLCSHPPPTIWTSRSCRWRTSGNESIRAVHHSNRSLNKGMVLLPFALYW